MKIEKLHPSRGFLQNPEIEEIEEIEEIVNP